MEQKINVAELLKDCPSGMELDCTICDNVYFDEVTPHLIRCYIKNGTENNTIYFHHDGAYMNITNAKCVIFPKGKTTWEEFQRPFKDGDIVAANDSTWIGITTGGANHEFIPTYCVIKSDGEFEAYFDTKETWFFSRLATEEEKEKLFKVIKDNGYEWDPETKRLEKLVVPKFNVGDVIQDEDAYKVTITEVNVEDKLYEYESTIAKGIGGIAFSEQDNWKLVPNKFDITTLVPFESRVLVRANNRKWVAAFYSHYDTNSSLHYCVVGGLWYEQCIPYKGNERLLNTTDDCIDFYKTWK